MRDFKKSGSFGKRSSGGRPSFGGSRGPRPFGARDFNAPVEMHEATCNACHKMCEVPFRPNGKKPVYCSDCFKEQERTEPHDSPRSFNREDRGSRFSSPRSEGESAPASDLKKQFAVLNTKLDRLIAVIEAQTEVLSSK